MANFKHNLGKLVPECQTVLGFVSAPLNQFYMLWRHRNRCIIIIFFASRDDGGGTGNWNCEACANHLHRVQPDRLWQFFYSPDPLPAV